MLRLACFMLIITHASIAAGVGRAFSRVCLFVCLFVRAVAGKRLELSTPNLVHVYSSRSACIDPEVKRSKVKVTWLRHSRTVASDHDPYSVHIYAAVQPAAVAGVGLHVDTTAYVF